MRTDALDTLARTLVVDEGVSPAAVIGVGGRSGQGWKVSTGAAGVRSQSRRDPVDPSTPFDLASVTKPVVASAIARLVRRGRLRWETPIGKLVTELSRTESRDLPLILFVSHRAGLDAHRALYAPFAAGGSVELGACLEIAGAARRAECRGIAPIEGFAPLYSDLGFLIAGVAASRAADADLATVVTTEVTEPLGLEIAAAGAWRARNCDFPAIVAPTEVVPWRGGEIVGDVHDENAWALVGHGLAGHAGLFGTVEGVTQFGAAILDALSGRMTDWLEPEEAKILVIPRAGGTLRAGFDGRSPEGSSAGAEFGARSFGHLGFTGTSLWCDPDADVVAVGLTNRVNPTRDNVSIRSVRPRLHDALHRTGVALVRGGQP